MAVLPDGRVVSGSGSDFGAGQVLVWDPMEPGAGDLRLVLVAPVPAGHPGGGSRPMPDGTTQRPGGWNRFMLQAEDVATTAGELRAAGVKFRNEIVDGIGTRQVMIEDPSGNPVKLFEPKRAEARLAT